MRKNFLVVVLAFIIMSAISARAEAQMICCNGCYGGSCQVQSNCVFGGQSCSDECSGQGVSCGNTCTYNSNCPFYPNESCIGGACVQNTPTPTIPPPTSTLTPVVPTPTRTPQPTSLPAPTNASSACPYCSPYHSVYGSYISSCSSCNVGGINPSTSTIGSTGIINVFVEHDGRYYIYDVYMCQVARTTSNQCSAPFMTKIERAQFQNPQNTNLDGCWAPGCGPFPAGSGITPTVTASPTITPLPTSTPVPTFTPSPTACPDRCTGNRCGSFTIGGCSYTCSTNNCLATQYCENNVCTAYSCNDPCPYNGFNCGGGLWCSGLAGNVCRAPGNPSNASCVDGNYASPTPDPCGNNVCSANESCSTCSADCCPFVTAGVTNTPVPTSAHTFIITPNPCTMVSSTQCEATISWDTTNYPYVTVEDSTTTIGSGPTGSATVTIDTTTCVTYYLKSNGSTIDSESLCPQKNWVKLKNASYQSRSAVINPIPQAVQAYDSEDTSEAQFIIGESGLVTAPRLTPYPSSVSSTSWVRENYKPRIIMDKTKMINYIESRRKHMNITESELATIESGNIYVITGTSITITDPSVFNNKEVTIIVDGTLIFNIPSQTFIPDNGKVAFFAKDMYLYNPATDSNYLNRIDALLIADTINTGSVDNTTLKVNGNLITKTLENGRSHSLSSNQKPSIFVTVDPAMYISLLPVISVSKYEWKQLE